MFLSHEEEQVEIKTKSGSTRKFKLIEHTGDELDKYIEQTASRYDEAIETMQLAQKKLQYGQKLDSQLLFKIKEEIAEQSADLIASLLHPDDGLDPVNAAWVRKNTTRRWREKILDRQNELDGLETIKDQAFLIERGALIAALQVRQAMLQQEKEFLALKQEQGSEEAGISDASTSLASVT